MENFNWLKVYLNYQNCGVHRTKNDRHCDRFIDTVFFDYFNSSSCLNFLPSTDFP